MSLVDVSKGVEFYAFIENGYEIEIQKADAGDKDNPGTKKTLRNNGQRISFSMDHEEIHTKNWKFRYEGLFRFTAKKDGRELFERSIRINGNTGNIDIEDIRNLYIPARIENDYSLAFGIYDSDSGTLSNFPNSHQMYAYLTRNYSRWQQSLFSHARFDKSTAKLREIILPGSHDSGMYKYNNITVPLANMANTQKDTMQKQLELGARFFDYRPAKVLPAFTEFLSLVKTIGVKNAINMFAFTIPFLGPLVSVLDLIAGASSKADAAIDELKKSVDAVMGKYCHIHTVVPGETLDEFIGQAREFLENNPEEIVVIKISGSGILTKIPKVAGLEFDKPVIEVPDYDTVVKESEKLVAGSGLKIGNAASLEKSVSELITSHERLILIDNNGDGIISSWSEDNYNSISPGSIIKALDETVKTVRNNTDLKKKHIDLQLQLTSTATKDGLIRALSASENFATSPLLATKPQTDRETYEWLLRNRDFFRKNQYLTTVINDFYDNALTSRVVELNEQRFGF